MPGSASEVVVNLDCHSLDGWSSNDDQLHCFDAGSSGIYVKDSSSGFIHYNLPYPLPSDEDFGMTFTVHADVDTVGGDNGKCRLYVGLSDSSFGRCIVGFSSDPGRAAGFPSGTHIIY